MKKTFIMLLAMVFIFSLVLAGCTSKNNSEDSVNETADKSTNESTVTANDEFPIVKEKITLKVLMRGSAKVEDFNTNEFTKWLEDKTNIHIEWSITDEKDWQQKLNLVLSGGDLPDVIMGMDISPAQEMVYASQGLIIPLQDLIKEYAPNTQKMFKEKPEVESAITAPGGNIYSMPNVNECYHCQLDYKMYVFQPWLKKLNLQEPTTPDEFEKMLLAFKNQDPNGNSKKDEIPLAGAIASSALQSQIDAFLMNAFIYDDGEKRMMLDDGKIDVAYNKPEWKDGLTYLHKLYAQGLIAPQSLTQDKASLKKMTENPDIPILGAAPAHSPSTITIVEGPSGRWLDYQPIKPLKGPDGVQKTVWLRYGIVKHGQFLVTSANKFPEATIRWADAFYTNEMAIRTGYGSESVGWKWAEPSALGRDGKPALYEALMPLTGKLQNDSWGELGLGYRTDKDYYRGQAVTKLPNKEKMYYDVTKANYEPYKQSLDKIVPPLFFSKEQSGQLAELESNITTYFQTMTAKFINGDADIDKDWDNYVKTLEGIGLDQYLSIYQQAYDDKMKK